MQCYHNDVYNILITLEEAQKQHQFIPIPVLSDLHIHKCSFNIYIFTYLKVDESGWTIPKGQCKCFALGRMFRNV